MLALVLLELGARAVLRFGAGISLVRPDTALVSYYARLGPLLAREVRNDDDRIDVLLLGGSVLDERWSAIPHALAERLEQATGRPVRIHGAAASAQTTRDSAVLFEALAGQDYDVVLLYHGINDVRAGAVSNDRFRPTYAHVRRYRDLDTLLAWQDGVPAALPYALARTWDGLGDLFGREFADGERPRPDDAELAADRKTVAPFRANVEQVLDAARSRGIPVVLPTFAIWTPPDYSEAAFDARELAYGRHRIPTEAWGAPEVVPDVVDAHVEVVRELAQTDGARLVEVAGAISGDATHFDDICHLTVAGAVRFAELVTPALEAAIVGEHE